jgi:hypothetical protein
VIEFERTTDAALIRGVITHPAVFPFMFSDGGPTAEEYEPPVIDGLWYVAARIDGALAGVFIFVPQTAVWYDAHVCVLPHARPKATELYKGVLAWVRANTPCRKVTGNIPVYNPASLLVATGAGAKVIGVNKASIMKNGRLRDQVIVGVEL